jgi:hypothetical protein
MSILDKMDKIEPHLDEMQADTENIQKLMAQSESGRYAVKASLIWMGSQPMFDLMNNFEDNTVPGEERALLIEYMNDIISKDPARGMQLFANYLQTLIADPKYKNLKTYHQKVADNAIAVSKSQEYKDYMVLYEDFQNDNSPEAVAAINAMEAMQQKMQAWLK